MRENLVNGIFLDNDRFIDYGYTDIGEHTYSTVSIAINGTGTLVKIADAIREDAGYLPYWPTEKNPEIYDDDCWYNYYIKIDGCFKGKVDRYIEFCVCNSAQDDNECTYYIELTDEEQTAIYERIDQQCREKFEMSCEELLAEAKAELEI